MKVEPKGARIASREICARGAIGLALGAAALALSGCMGPTYGTGVPSEQQLAEDVTGALSLAPHNGEKIDYEPRPGIVMPASTAVLPPPQEDVASAGNPQWPESPEQRRERIRAEATAHQDDPSYKSGVVPTAGQSAAPAQPRTRWSMMPQEEDRGRTREAFNKRIAENQQGSATQRRFLSEPPLTYRQPASTAPVNDVGDDEWKKKKALENNLPAQVKGKY